MAAEHPPDTTLLQQCSQNLCPPSPSASSTHRMSSSIQRSTDIIKQRLPTADVHSLTARRQPHQTQQQQPIDMELLEQSAAVPLKRAAPAPAPGYAA